MQIFGPAYSLDCVQSADLNRFEIHRQRGIVTSFFKSIQITQTYCQKEERFTVQNKMIDASPHERTDTKNQIIYSSQILICHKERSAVQNKKTA